MVRRGGARIIAVTNNGRGVPNVNGSTEAGDAVALALGLPLTRGVGASGGDDSGTVAGGRGEASPWSEVVTGGLSFILCPNLLQDIPVTKSFQ